MIVGKIENDLGRGFVKHRLNCLLITDPLSPKDTGVSTNHSVITFHFNAFIKAPPKTLRLIATKIDVGTLSSLVVSVTYD